MLKATSVPIQKINLIYGFLMDIFEYFARNAGWISDIRGWGLVGLLTVG